MNLPKNEFDNDYDTYLNRVDCFNVFNQKYVDRCNFVRTIPDCKNADNVIPLVIHLMECKLETHSRWAEWVLISITVLFAFYLGLIITIIANDFPALKVVAKFLRMSDHLAGVTLLAFGNSADEFLSHIASIGQGEQIIPNCMSKSIFICTMAGGMICYVRPFEMKGYESMRDVMFFLAGLIFLDYAVKDDKVCRFESACFIGIYVLYVVVNVIDVCLENQQIRHLDKILHRRSNQSLSNTSKTSYVGILRRPSSTLVNKRSTRFTTRVSKAREYVDIEATRKTLYSSAHPKNYHLFRDLLDSINPFNGEEWSESSTCMKIFMILKAPVCLITQICIPVVDVEADKHGWSKLLNCIQIVINIPIGLVLTDNEEQISFMLYSFLVTTPIAIFILIHSRTDLPPFYHNVFAFLSCTGSLFFIFAAAKFIEQVLLIIGSFAGLSKDFCGATIWGWGFAIGDVIANIVLAIQGYEHMAYAACIGGPFFTLFVSAGVVYSVETWESNTGQTNVDRGVYGDNAYVFLLLALGTTLIWATILNYQTRRSIGIFSISLYVLYLIFAVLIEKEVIHTFKRDDLIGLI